MIFYCKENINILFKSINNFFYQFHVNIKKILKFCYLLKINIIKKQLIDMKNMFIIFLKYKNITLNK